MNRKEITEWLRKRFNPSLKFTVNVSPAHLDALKNKIIKDLEAEVKKEKRRKRKPATVAYKEIKSWNEERFNSWVINSTIDNAASKILTDQARSLINKK